MNVLLKSLIYILYIDGSHSGSSDGSYDPNDNESEYLISSPRNPTPTSRSVAFSTKSRPSTAVSTRQVRPPTPASARSIDTSCITEPVPIQTYGTWTNIDQNINNNTSKLYSNPPGKDHSVLQYIQDDQNLIGDDQDYSHDLLDDEYISDDGQSSDEETSFPQYVINDTSGACAYVDMIKRLPVHISKNILGMLERVDLANCLCVSRHWRILVEQVQSDNMLQQQVWEEIMLMKVQKHGYNFRNRSIQLFKSYTKVDRLFQVHFN